MQFPEGVSHDVQGADRYLGIDPGLNRTGYAILDRTSSGPRLREGGIIRSNASGSLPQRLRELTTGLTEVLGSFNRRSRQSNRFFPWAAILARLC